MNSKILCFITLISNVSTFASADTSEPYRYGDVGFDLFQCAGDFLLAYANDPFNYTLYFFVLLLAVGISGVAASMVIGRAKNRS